MILDVFGNGSYLSLINPELYESFVGKNWAENERLLEPHFIEQMKKHSGLFWDTGFETDWRVEIRNAHTTEKGFREIVGSLIVTDGAIYIANYDSLTMAAQFNDHKLPDKNCQGYSISAPKGVIDVRIIQRVDPNIYFASPECEEKTRVAEFLVEIEPSSKAISSWVKVPWSKL